MKATYPSEVTMTSQPLFKQWMVWNGCSIHRCQPYVVSHTLNNSINIFTQNTLEFYILIIGEKRTNICHVLSTG